MHQKIYCSSEKRYVGDLKARWMPSKMVTRHSLFYYMYYAAPVSICLDISLVSRYATRSRTLFYRMCQTTIVNDAVISRRLSWLVTFFSNAIKYPAYGVLTRSMYSDKSGCCWTRYSEYNQIMLTRVLFCRAFISSTKQQILPSSEQSAAWTQRELLVRNTETTDSEQLPQINVQLIFLLCLFVLYNFYY